MQISAADVADERRVCCGVRASIGSAASGGSGNVLWGCGIDPPQLGLINATQRRTGMAKMAFPRENYYLMK
jgi:hypothetical protein